MTVAMYLLLTLSLSSAAAIHLNALKAGDALRGEVVGHYRNDATGKTKLFLRVPVERTGPKGSSVTTMDAYLNLPRKHPMVSNPTAALEKKLSVHVLRAQPDSARLSVALKPPATRGQPPPDLAHLSKRERTKRAATDPSAYPHRLEDLTVGTLLNATVVTVKSFGAFVDAGVSRAGRSGTRAPVDALLPADQLPSGAVLDTFLKPGRQLEGLRVLRPSPGSGRLLLTAVPIADGSSLTAMLETRASAKRRAGRRPSLSSLAAQVGSLREGVVVSIAPYGAVVNVGARRSGLIHISQLAPPNSKGSFVDGVETVCNVGDQVLVKVLPRSNAKRLALRLVKVFPKDESEVQAAKALLRSSETLLPQYTRVEDTGMNVNTAVLAVEAAIEVDQDAAWAAYEAAQQPDDDDEMVEEGDEEEEVDPWAWAAASAEDAAGSEGQEDDDDPWAWAAADTSFDGIDDGEGAEDGEKTDASSSSAGPDLDDPEYFEDKYDIDFY